MGVPYDELVTDKKRLSASVDAELVDAGQAAVANGDAPTFSAWVNRALRSQAEHDRRMRALDDFLAAYESEHGEITEDEIRQATRSSRERAVVVRGSGGRDEGA